MNLWFNSSCLEHGKVDIPYVSEGFWRGFVFSRPAASVAARAVNAALSNDLWDIGYTSRPIRTTFMDVLPPKLLLSAFHSIHVHPTLQPLLLPNWGVRIRQLTSPLLSRIHLSLFPIPHLCAALLMPDAASIMVWDYLSSFEYCFHFRKLSEQTPHEDRLQRWEKVFAKHI